MINIAIVGGGKGGTSILKAFSDIEGFEIIGICDINPDAPGLKLAVTKKVPIYTDLLDILSHPEIDVVIEATGIREVRETINEKKRQSIKLIDSDIAHLVMTFSEAHDKVLKKIAEQQFAEEALRKTQQQLSNIIESLPDATFAVDLDGKVIAWNKEVEKMTGVKAEDILGKGDQEYSIPFYGYKRPMLVDMIKSPHAENEKLYKSCKTENGVLVAEGKIKVVYGSGEAYAWGIAAPFYDDEGNIIGMIESLRDITEFKKTENALRDSEQRLADIINFLPDATFAIDRNGKVISWNIAAEEMTGINANEIIGKGDYEYSIPFYGYRRPTIIDFVLQPEEQLENTYPEIKRDRDTLIGENFCPAVGGSGAYLRATAAPLYDSNGSVVGAIESIRDATENRKTEKELLRIKKAIESASNAIWLNDVKAKTMIYQNEAFTKLFKYTMEEINSLGGIPILYFEQELAKKIFTSLKRGHSWLGEIEMRDRYGKGIPVSLFGDAVQDETGETVAYLGIATDITERKRYEKELIESRQRMADIIELLPDATMVINQEGELIAWNRAMEEMTGVKAEEVLGKRNYEYALPFYEKQRPGLINMVLNSSDEIDKYYSTILNANGVLIAEANPVYIKGKEAILWCQANVLYDTSGNISGAIESVRDITEQKRAEEEIKKSEVKYRNIIETANEGICIIDDNHKISFANQKMADMFGYRMEEIVGTSFLEFIEDDPKDFKKRIERRRQGISEQFDCKINCKDGTERWVIVSSKAISDESGRHLGSLEMITDITERKKAEAALIEIQQRMADIINFLPDASLVIDLEGKVITWNKAAEEMTGIKAEEIIGKDDYEYALPIYGVKRPLLIDLVLKTDKEIEKKYPHIERKGKTLIGENYCPAVRGRGAYLRATASPLYDSIGNIAGAIESFRDATEQKRAEEQMEFLSLYDSLTGLYNRNYFEEELHRIQNSRAVYSVGVVVCDIDGLKMVNDSFGHEAGDGLLKAAASVVRGSFRKGELVARTGGDEIAVVMENIDNKNLEKSVQRIRIKAEEYNQMNPRIPISISVGFAGGDDEFNVYDLYKQADNNMYREKLRRKQSSRSAIVQTLMKALETRDFLTKGHAERLQSLTISLARMIGLSENRLNDLFLLAQFHDIGKVGITDRILFKPGPLTDGERAEMQRHCEMGHRIALSAPDLTPIADWILKHHEWWNGEGYPLGLKGEEIPLECRIIAIVDAYDAMTSNRPYRKAMGHKAAVDELIRCSGTQFDPHLVEIFIKSADLPKGLLENS